MRGILMRKMKTSSLKNKARLLQQWVRDRILFYYPQLDPEDVRSTGMGQQGEDIQLSPKAREYFPFSVECKSRANISVYKFYEQSKENSKDNTPIVVIKANRKPPLVVLDLEDFLNIFKGKPYDAK